MFVSFDCSKQDAFWAHSIAMRAAREFNIPLLDIEMDIVACHTNGNPLKLRKLLTADDFNFAHDVLGIRRHLDRKTGKLLHCFVPRYSKGG